MSTRQQTSVIVGLLLCCCAQDSMAARLISVQVKKDNVLIFHTGLTAADRDSTASIWRYLDGQPLGVWDKNFTIPEDKTTVTLTGAIEIRMMHTDTELAVASLDRLVLVRNENPAGWIMPSTEIERSAQAAGLGEPHLSYYQKRNRIVAVGIFVTTLIGCIVMLERKKKRGPISLTSMGSTVLAGGVCCFVLSIVAMACGQFDDMDSPSMMLDTACFLMVLTGILLVIGGRLSPFRKTAAGDTNHP